ncbi:hypothetical protein [Pseudodonghicola flavimaris]|uniref:Uncharacterized protein n=1 Tax=Pseudodonghicola flavimaris TaxID=3050036 RepID=A0ABT7EVK1_9RHOB|nr:hypothetical protein [Pseudodonghicola flavimaris]MDK3016378.1 hypothetical protein [Pseudodonghicola flavimaris]
MPAPARPLSARRLPAPLFGVFLLAALPAAAAPARKAPDCYCSDRHGARIELGETLCLEVDGRRFTAQCQMSLNVPMWRELFPGCLSSRLEGLQPALHPRPVHTEI